ncbi:MAG TPA: nucleotide exchange factor GrpE, partial [Planctomycetota bacterium]|nr:nucleotide exchange factor GrpE [Planctomycetota bacterium]
VPEPGGAGDPTESPPAGEAQLAELKDKWLRALAELENVRRASRIESEQVRMYGATPLLQALLGVLDNLQRALAAPPAGLDREYLAGLQLIERQFADTLAAYGVKPVPAERGQRFDPTLHRALMEQESSEVEPGAILTPVVPGYRLHDRLLREAQVVVARAPQAGA